eukprot:694120-Rhodomonas_salina.1
MRRGGAAGRSGGCGPVFASSVSSQTDEQSNGETKRTPRNGGRDVGCVVVGTATSWIVLEAKACPHCWGWDASKEIREDGSIVGLGWKRVRRESGRVGEWERRGGSGREEDRESGRQRA